MKICSTCKIEKTEIDFYPRADGVGLRADCKKCWSQKAAFRHKHGPLPKEDLQAGVHDGFRKCKTCDEIKLLSEYKKRSDSGAYRSDCNACKYLLDKERREKPENILKQKEVYKAWRKKYPDKYKDYIYKKSYGISLDEYNKLYDQQGGCCLICGKHGSTVRQSLYVDHCHNSKKVRGLLCYSCNMALGQFKDSIERLEAAIAYLKRYKI